MRICLITDTWDNVNGVVTTLRATVSELKSRGHEICVIEPSQFKTISAPGYSEVKLSWNLWKIGKIIKDFDPDAIHIATEGPLGVAARCYCNWCKLPYNTSYHTKFPEYINIYHHIPLCIGYWLMRMFHKDSHKILVTTETMKNELTARGFKNLAIWNRGVDHSMFTPGCRCNNVASKPILLCVSRASLEKNLDEFCSIQTTGTKILVGDGPYLEELKKKYTDVIYTGYKSGKSLVHYYANADVTVFPSKTDTFGVVMIESMACGTPVAAYPVTGPKDVITSGITGVMSDILTCAIDDALQLNRQQVQQHSLNFSWPACTDVFESSLVIRPRFKN